MADLSCNFNDQSLIGVKNRINGIDVLQEPLLMGRTVNGDYIVHERLGPTMLFDYHSKDGVNVYSADEFKDRYGDKCLMTYEQYKRDQHTLSDARLDPLMDELTRSQFLYMRDRIEEIGKDMQEFDQENSPQPLSDPSTTVVKPLAIPSQGNGS
ncbi:MAG: hypothetical protein KDI46_06720 [Alphaproteobacteria bacterium]|nr:hypothetical protein [Alphaproteobacteria bacterium]